MGLDQSAFRIKAKPVSQVDFDFIEDPDYIQTWRKHPNLQGWMENLYYEKGGKKPSFNCVNVELKWEDILELERVIKEGKLPETEGFFFGQSRNSFEEKEKDLRFIESAKEAIAEGDFVVYTSWW